MKKYLIILIILCMGAFQSHAQVLVADAGADKYVCQQWSATVFDTAQLGGAPTAQGGVPPYTYKWYITPQHAISTLYYYASDCLVDSTVANPLFIDPILSANDSLLIYLEITDSIGSKAYDTVKIYISSYLSSLTLGNFGMHYGDSVFSGYVAMGGGIGPLSWLWKPNHGLVDSTQPIPGWLKPTQPVTDYICTVIDRFGCADTGGGTRVTVFPLSADDINQTENITVYPNPTSNSITISTANPFHDASLKVLNSLGQLIIERNDLSGEKFEINISNLANGVYYLELMEDSKVSRIKLIKQ